MKDLHRCHLPTGKSNRTNDKVAVAIHSVARAWRKKAASCSLVVLVECSSVAGRGDACRSDRRVDLPEGKEIRQLSKSRFTCKLALTKTISVTTGGFSGNCSHVMNEPSSYSTRHSSPPHTDASAVMDGLVEEQPDLSEIDDLELDSEGVTDAGMTTDPAG